MTEPTPTSLPASRRISFLIGAAFAIVVLILAVTIWRQIENEYAQGILTLVLGRMLGYVDSIYNYEFGTTRSSTRKDETIGELTKTAAVVATTVQATQAAADAAATTGGGAAAVGEPSAPLQVGEVAIQADNVTVDSSPTTTKGNP